MLGCYDIPSPFIFIMHLKIELIFYRLSVPNSFLHLNANISITYSLTFALTQKIWNNNKKDVIHNAIIKGHKFSEITCFAGQE